MNHTSPAMDGIELQHRRDTSDNRAILVVDDDAAIRNMLRLYLEDQGFQVWTVATGTDALSYLANNAAAIALVLLDIQMPGLDGPQTFDGIRQLNAQVPVCFMTADAGEYKTNDLLGRGAKCVLEKPFQMMEIARIVQRLLSES